MKNLWHPYSAPLIDIVVHQPVVQPLLSYLLEHEFPCLHTLNNKLVMTKLKEAFIINYDFRTDNMFFFYG